MMQESFIRFYVKTDSYRKEPTIRITEVADSGEYWEITIYTHENPTFEIDAIG